ncbi:hypothetical protein D3C75_679900 [compost metagenome]
MLKARLAQMHMHVNQARNQQLAFRIDNFAGFFRRKLTFNRCNDSVLNYDMLDFQFAVFVQYAGVSNDHGDDSPFACKPQLQALFVLYNKNSSLCIFINPFMSGFFEPVSSIEVHAP